MTAAFCKGLCRVGFSWGLCIGLTEHSGRKLVVAVRVVRAVMWCVVEVMMRMGNLLNGGF